MSEDLMLVQRIKSASDIDVRTQNFIYELTDKGGRWSFLHRSVDGVFKPNFTKRLFYYVNTSEFDLELSLKDIPFKDDRINADIVFRLQLCPTADFDKDPELANWIANEQIDVLRVCDLRSRLTGRLAAYFSRIVNGATSLALVERYGKGAIKDDFAAWNDSGLPSWLYIAKTSSADITRLPSEAEREINQENERIARSKARTREVQEQIDVAVSEAKLELAREAISHHIEQLRQRRQLVNAQYALMLQQLETAKERDLRAREIEQLEHEIAKDSHRIDLEIKYEGLKAAQAKTQATLDAAEDARKESAAKIQRINQEIEESKERIRAIIIHTSIWRKILLLLLTLCGIGVIVSVGVILFQEKKVVIEKKDRVRIEQLRQEIQTKVDAFDRRFSEIKVRFDSAPWRKWQITFVEQKIAELRNKLKQDFGQGECDKLCETITGLIDRLNGIGQDRLLEEKQAVTQLEELRDKVANLLKVWPNDLPERSHINKLNADLSFQDINVQSNLVDVVRIQELSKQVGMYTSKKLNYKEDIKRAIQNNLSQPLDYYPAMLKAFEHWSSRTYTSDEAYFRDIVFGKNLLTAFNLFPKFDYTIKRLEKIENEAELMGAEKLHTVKHIPLLDYVLAQTNAYITILSNGKDVSKIVEDTVSARETAELTLKLLREDDGNVSNQIDLLKRNKEWDKLVEFCNAQIKKLYGGDGSDRFVKVRSEAQFHMLSDKAILVGKKFKQSCPLAYSAMWDYRNKQKTVKELLSADLKQEIASVVTALPNLEDLRRINAFEHFPREVFEMYFLSEVMYYVNGRSPVDAVGVYNKLNSVGDCWYRLAKIDLHELYEGISVHGSDDERRTFRIKALNRARMNGCSFDIKPPLIMEQGFY